MSADERQTRRRIKVPVILDGMWTFRGTPLEDGGPYVLEPWQKDHRDFLAKDRRRNDAGVGCREKQTAAA